MAGPASARSNGALRSVCHGGKTARPAMGSPSSTRSDRALLRTGHGRKSTRPVVRGAPALRRHRTALRQAHGRKPTGPAMKGASPERCNSAPLFRIHRCKPARRFMFVVWFVTPATPRRRRIMVGVVKSLLTPPHAFARRGKSRLPSSFYHNFPFPFSPGAIKPVSILSWMYATPRDGS